jgi:hypothetical protein
MHSSPRCFKSVKSLKNPRNDPSFLQNAVFEVNGFPVFFRRTNPNIPFHGQVHILALCTFGFEIAFGILGYPLEQHSQLKIEYKVEDKD